MNQTDYGYKAMTFIPTKMHPWHLRIQIPYPSPYGEYVLIDIDQADIEQHHQVEVIDENGSPLRGVWVIFGFPGGGPHINLAPQENHWYGAPRVLMGNAQRTNFAGYAQHTFGSGGEDIWLWDLEGDGALRLPSPIVQNCTWVRRPAGLFEHTGVKLLFQRRRAGIVPQRQKIELMEARLKAIEDQLGIAPQ